MSKPISIAVVVVVIVVVVLFKKVRSKKCFVPKSLGQKIVDPKKIWNQNNLRSKQFWAQKNVAQKKFGTKDFIQKNFGTRNIWVKWNFVKFLTSESSFYDSLMSHVTRHASQSPQKSCENVSNCYDLGY